MIKMSLVSLFLLSSLTANASIFECTRVDDADDWRVSLDLDSGAAEFFDNDSTSEGSLKFSTKSMPPTHTFKSDKKGDNWTFQFSEVENDHGFLFGLLILEDARIEMNCSEVQDDQD